MKKSSKSFRSPLFYFIIIIVCFSMLNPPSFQAPGGHNVIAGIFDGIKAWNKVGFGVFILAIGFPHLGLPKVH